MWPTDFDQRLQIEKNTLKFQIPILNLNCLILIERLLMFQMRGTENRDPLNTWDKYFFHPMDYGERPTKWSKYPYLLIK
jgi:hypothetical protein